jgi:hypothetical protein
MAAIPRDPHSVGNPVTLIGRCLGREEASRLRRGDSMRSGA